ncbi:Dsc2p NDAI_0B02640 [Naumovozyma dairenensis CBS 421]|uniref:Peptidase S54 rhomboid domain-containing protein n=1 Tax=Naumovozyma dairenensis (strain ATCC 10597 / BCRC 20456 / CBS 421 / NBRC 0211 / NRRL Y-12639) TaxID=1071378 RepID=G0W688_NAUDC|nr:hypothetical protein NDAI_0B02640 [Naumovozyma dairenensis CBS 421]CCD23299.1 hypothetical protein NDAI_0B02640 [Naumovozyma dairenensis CBS 421]
MSLEGPTGLFQYPVTKLAMICTGAIPLLAAIGGYKYLFITRYDPFISEYHQYYRLLTFQLASINESNVVLSILIWYQFRHLERLMGSYKYFSVITLLFLYTTLIISCSNLIFNAFLPWNIWNRFPSGSLPLLLSLFHFYKQYTPQIYQFEILLTKPIFSKSKDHNKQMKWELNDHFFLNTLIFILILNQDFVGIICGFVSWLCGVFVDKHLLPGLNKWRLPYIWRYFNEYKSVQYTSGTNNVDPTVGIIMSSNTYNNGQQFSSTTSVNTLLHNGNSHANNNNNNNNGSSNNGIGINISNPLQTQGTTQTTEEENAADEPVRPLGVQFLDTFRR